MSQSNFSDWIGVRLFGRRSCRFWTATILAVVILTNMASLVVAEHDDEDSRERKTRYSFQRIATFPVFLNTSPNLQTVAEIVDASEDGKLLLYTDSQNENLGFVDINNPHDPLPGGVVSLGGAPTSVAVAGPWALAVVNTSPSLAMPSGQLKVVDLATRSVVRTLELEGQPDCIALSPDRRYAAITIENERDEDLGDGRPPQSPPGFLVIVDLIGSPSQWSLRKVDLVGIADLFPEDPEPEFVDINIFNIAAVTLQENNHIVLVHLPTGTILHHWSAGLVDLSNVDVTENNLIELEGNLFQVPREPDGVAWISPFQLATADEGDLDGGSRGFTIFDLLGKVQFTSGNAFEHLVTRLGHYPEERSENAGNEPEGVEFSTYSAGRFLFVGSERSSVVVVYQVDFFRHPKLLQVLPAGVGPEGLLAIPKRNLLAVASEEDDRAATVRSTITLYQLKRGGPTYPTMLSANRTDKLPVPWAGLSGLAADPDRWNQIYTIYDSFYRESRIFPVQVSGKRAVITDEIILRDSSDKTLNLDAEGIAVRKPGGFWIASEGAGSVDDPMLPVTSVNLLLTVTPSGTVLDQIQLPAAVNELQRRFGFEGVAAVGSGQEEVVYVAFQREWVNDPKDQVRIGRYEVATEAWSFFYYPLDTPTSPNGGWVGLSELVALTPRPLP